MKIIEERKQEKDDFLSSLQRNLLALTDLIKTTQSLDIYVGHNVPSPRYWICSSRPVQIGLSTQNQVAQCSSKSHGYLCCEVSSMVAQEPLPLKM